MAIFTYAPPTRYGQDISEFSTSYTRAAVAAGQTALYESPFMAFSNYAEIAELNAPPTDPNRELTNEEIIAGVELPAIPEKRLMSAEEARAKLAELELDQDLTIPESGIYEPAFDKLVELKRNELLRRSVMERGPTGFLAGATQLAAAFGASVLDPINVASAFVPVVGQARYAQMLAASRTTLGRVGARAQVGAIEGFAGAVMVEPISYYSLQMTQADYTTVDSMLNIGFGAAFGSGLHVIGGSGADLYRSWRNRPDPFNRLQGLTIRQIDQVRELDNLITQSVRDGMTQEQLLSMVQNYPPEVLRAAGFTKGPAGTGAPETGAKATDTADFQDAEVSAPPGTVYGDDGYINIGETEVPTQWAVIDLVDLEATMTKADNQWRDRTRQASAAQIRTIAANPNYDLLQWSPIMDYGAPTISADGLVIGGNGRVMGLSMAYDGNTAGNYRSRLLANMDKFGLDASTIDGMSKPALIRILKQQVDIKRAAIISNEGGSARMSALEQSAVDADRLGDIRAFDIPDSGDLNTAGNYRSRLLANMDKFGLDASTIDGMSKPALIRILKQQVDIKRAAIISNEGGSARMSALEQSAVDADRLGDIRAFDIPDSGDLNTAGNRTAIQQWVGKFPDTQRPALLTAEGYLSKEGLMRLRNAMLFRAYGDSPILKRIVESTDAEFLNLQTALIRASGAVADAKQRIDAGDLYDLDLGDDLRVAIDKLSDIRGRNMDFDDFVRQGDIMGLGMTDVQLQLLQYFDNNLRSARMMTALINEYYRALDNLGDPKQADIFGEAVVPTKMELLESAMDAVERDPSAATRVNRLSPETRELALRASVAQLAEGREVEVEPIVNADPSINTATPESTMAAARANNSADALISADPEASVKADQMKPLDDVQQALDEAMDIATEVAQRGDEAYRYSLAEEKSPVEEALDAFEETGDINTALELADELESLILADRAPEALQDAIDQFRAEFAEDLEIWGGRSDMVEAEQMFVDEVRRIIAGIEPRVEEPVYTGYAEAGIAERKDLPMKQTEQLALDFAKPDEIPVAAAQMADNFAVHYKRVPTSEIKSGFDTVTNDGEAAHVLAPIRKLGEEVMVVLTLDQNRKVIDVQYHAKGTRAGSQVYPDIMIPSLAATPGARFVYFAHNHPSGKPDPSVSDYRITDELIRVLDGTNIQVEGHIVFGAGKTAYKIDKAGYPDAKAIEITPAVRKRDIPVTQRVLRKRTNQDIEPLDNPEKAIKYFQDKQTDSGLLLLNTRNQPIGILSLTAEEMANLRQGNRIERVYTALDQTNADAVMIRSDDIEAAKNMARFLNLAKSVRVLDAIYEFDGEFRSDAARYEMIVKEQGVFYSFAGVESMTAPRMKLAEAIDLENANTKKEAIYEKTGWLRGIDGIWRYEISDDKANLTDFFRAPAEESQDTFANFVEKWYLTDRFEIKLSDLLDHPTLYDAYPELRDFTVMTQFGTGGKYDLKTSIYVGRDLPMPYVKSLLLHEIQHAIQEIEGFARGGNDDTNFTNWIKNNFGRLSREEANKLADWKWTNNFKIDTAQQAAETARFGLVYESAQRLRNYANRDKPSGVFRLIRNEANWLYESQWQSLPEVRDLVNRFYGIPRKMDARNAHLRDLAWDIADFLTRQIPEERLSQFQEDPRNLRSMINALQRQSAKARKDLQEMYDLERRFKRTVAFKTSVMDKTPWQIYEALAGEMEARLTQERMEMTPEMRAERFPITPVTAGVPLEQAIIYTPAQEFRLPIMAYSKAAPVTRTQVDLLTNRVRESFGDSTAALLDAARIRIVETPEDLPPRPDGKPHDARAQGMTAPDGTVYLVASRVDPNNVRGVVLHEVGEHVGMRDMLGDELYADLQRQFIKGIERGDVKFLEAAARVPDNTPLRHVASEQLAYLIENAPELNIVRRIIAAVRAWLYRTFDFVRNRIELTDGDIQALAIASLHAEARKTRLSVDGVMDYQYSVRADGPDNMAAEMAEFDAAIKRAEEYAKAVRAVAEVIGDENQARQVMRSQGNFTEQEITELLDLLREKNTAVRARLRKVRTMATAEDRAAGLQSEAMQAANELANDLVGAEIIRKRNEALNMAARKRGVSFVLKEFAGMEAEGFKGLLAGSQMKRVGARASVQAEQDQFLGELMGGIIADMERDNLWSVFISETMSRETARALFNMDRPNADMTGIPKEAVRMAEIIHKYQEVARSTQNRHGAWIGKTQGYIVRQSHDPFRIRAASFEEWRDFILPKIDAERTFVERGVENIELSLRTMYDNFASGVHLKFDPDEELAVAFRGQGRSIAKKASESRIIHFKDGDSWFDYNEKFGTAKFADSVLSGLERSARSSGLMKLLGTNPESNLTRMIDEVEASITGDHKGRIKFHEQRKAIMDLLHVLDGSANMPGNMLAARIGSNIRVVQSTAKLGGAVISSIADIPVYAAEQQFQGRGFLSGIGDAIGGLLQGRGSKEQQEIMNNLGVFFDGMRNGVLRRFDAENNLGGAMTSLQTKFFKWNALTWWTEVLQKSSAMSLSSNLAFHRGARFADLKPELQNLLSLYNIDAGKWDLIRMASMREADGYTYLTPEGLNVIPRASMEAYLAKIGRKVTDTTIDNLVKDMQGSLRSMFIDRAEHAVVTPDARTKQFLLRGTQPGTVWGETARFIAQFKSFPVVLWQRGLGKQVYGKGYDNMGDFLKNGKGDILGLVNLILWMTLFGYAAMSIKDLLKGRTPRDPRGAATWMSAMMQGGAFGIYGDFLFGEMKNRFGGGFLATAAGPTFGTVEDIADLYGRLRDGEDAASSAFRVAVANTPFMNLFYTRIALDYLILYRIQEWMNPGYLRRMERTIEQNNAQQFLIQPSEAIR